MTMTAEEQTGGGQHIMEGEDITPKKDGGVLKVNNHVFVLLARLTLAALASMSCYLKETNCIVDRTAQYFFPRVVAFVAQMIYY